MKTVIVKLGGAAITDKRCVDQLSSSLDALTEQISEAYHHLHSLNQPHQFILIHGAGSFGHPPAKEYSIKQGWNNNINNSALQHRLTESEQKYGLTLTRQKVLHLHFHLLQRLHAHGLPVVTVAAFDYVQTKDGYPTNESSQRLADRVHHILSLGFIPLLFGDAVLDTSLGCTILSGDVIMYQLATHLPNRVDRCVFVTDVQGIFTDDPKRQNEDENRKATLIKHIQVSKNSGHTLADGSGVGGDCIADVTGGMNGKVKWINRIIMESPVPEVIVCQVGSPEVVHSITLQPITDQDGKMAVSLDNLSLTVFTGIKDGMLGK